jgi:hypothetical protein
MLLDLRSLRPDLQLEVSALVRELGTTEGELMNGLVGFALALRRAAVSRSGWLGSGIRCRSSGEDVDDRRGRSGALTVRGPADKSSPRQRFRVRD